MFIRPGKSVVAKYQAWQEKAFLRLQNPKNALNKSLFKGLTDRIKLLEHEKGIEKFTRAGGAIV